VAAPRSWPWRRTALLLAGAAQLITISALPGADPIPVTWASLLLAVGLAVSQLGARARRLKVVAVTDEGYLAQRGILLGRPPRLEPDGTIVTGHARWDVELSGLPAEDVELRVFSSGQYHGRFMLTPSPGSRPTRRARRVALTLADLTGRSLGTRPAVQAAP